MKKIITALETQHDLLKDLIQDRRDEATDMSFDWQNSDACEVHESENVRIENQCEELFNVISELKGIE